MLRRTESEIPSGGQSRKCPREMCIRDRVKQLLCSAHGKNSFSNKKYYGPILATAREDCNRFYGIFMEVNPIFIFPLPHPSKKGGCCNCCNSPAFCHLQRQPVRLGAFPVILDAFGCFRCHPERLLSLSSRAPVFPVILSASEEMCIRDR